jgi:hypothetical protein
MAFDTGLNIQITAQQQNPSSLPSSEKNLAIVLKTAKDINNPEEFQKDIAALAAVPYATAPQDFEKLNNKDQLVKDALADAKKQLAPDGHIANIQQYTRDILEIAKLEDMAKRAEMAKNMAEQYIVNDATLHLDDPAKFAQSMKAIAHAENLPPQQGGMTEEQKRAVQKTLLLDASDKIKGGKSFDADMKGIAVIEGMTTMTDAQHAPAPAKTTSGQRTPDKATPEH